MKSIYILRKLHAEKNHDMYTKVSVHFKGIAHDFMWS